MDFITIDVAKREKLGSAESNRMRREDRVPGVLYGMQRPNIELSIGRVEVERFLKTGSQLVELKLGDKARPAILREMQTDAITGAILHVDFVRVDDDAEVETEVPLNFKGRAEGENTGGVFTPLVHTVVVKAKPRSLPRQYTFDVTDVQLDQVVTLADLEQREGVSFLEELDFPIATCAEPKVEAEATEGEDEGEAEAEAGAEATPAAE